MFKGVNEKESEEIEIDVFIIYEMSTCIIKKTMITFIQEKEYEDEDEEMKKVVTEDEPGIENEEIDKNIIIYYGEFDWIDYVNKNVNLKVNKKEDIYYEYIKQESKKNIPIYFEVKNKNYKFYSLNNLDVSYIHFEWESYIILNNDLKEKGINTKEKAWNHWINSGKIEERPFSFINNTNTNKGRFGNLFFVNMYLHFLSLQYNLKCNYKYENNFKKLGIYFNNTGQYTYNKNLLITETNYLTILKNKYEPSNIIITNENFYQNKEFCLLLQKYFNRIQIREQVIHKNIFINRYRINNDLFIHVRLGDVYDRTNFLLPYYEKLINNIHYNKAYIASDSIESSFCKELIKKYNLYVVNLTDVETIMFGTTCKYIVLSGGSFSWLIGFLAFFSDFIYYPDMKRFESKWFGDIFNFQKWICIKDF